MSLRQFDVNFSKSMDAILSSNMLEVVSSVWAASIEELNCRSVRTVRSVHEVSEGHVLAEKRNQACFVRGQET
jgi:hypothetical protein